MLYRTYTALSRIIPFPINGDICQIFPAPLYLMPRWGVLVEFCNADWAKSKNDAHSTVKKFDYASIRYDTESALHAERDIVLLIKIKLSWIL